MSKNRIDLILCVLVLSPDLTGLDCGNDRVNKSETLSVRFLNDILIGQVDIALMIGSFLLLSVKSGSCFDNSLKTVAGGGSGVKYGAAELLGQLLDIDLGALLLIYIVLVQCNDNGNTELEQLGGEEQ